MDLFSRYDDVKINGTIIKNLFKKIQIQEIFKNDINVFGEHTLVEGEMPEDVAKQYYGDKKYTWVILAANNIIDYDYDWYMTTKQLRKWASLLFAEQLGQTGDRTIEEIFEDIYKENELKQNIKYIHPLYLSKFLTEVESKI